MRELFLQIAYGRTQTAFSEDGLPIGAGLEDLGKGLRSQVGTTYATLAKGPRYLELAEGYITKCAVDENDTIIGYKFVHLGKMMEMIINNYGHLDILVNNAGITRDGLIMKMSEEDFDRVLDTNLKGAFHTIRHASRYFLKQKSGKIINISSVSGVMGNAGQANYSASKAGVIGLTKSVARELASRGITCNAVAPGFIETEMTEAMPEAAREAVKKQIPLQRTGQVSDVAGVAAFLASDLADYITGQVISVDGGMHM